MMENNVYIFFCGNSGHNVFCRIKKEALPSIVKRTLFFNPSFGMYEPGYEEESVQIGKETLKGRWAVFPWRGEMAAKESSDEIRNLLKGCNTLLLVGGLGGGFGSGVSPIFAKIARRMGIRVVAFFWTPFRFEGPRRAQRAAFYQQRLADICDICYFFDQSMIHERINLSNSFSLADELMVNGIKDFLAKLQE
jgi:cell division protein FtsZ